MLFASIQGVITAAPGSHCQSQTRRAGRLSSAHKQRQVQNTFSSDVQAWCSVTWPDSLWVYVVSSVLSLTLLHRVRHVAQDRRRGRGPLERFGVGGDCVESSACSWRASSALKPSALSGGCRYEEYDSTEVTTGSFHTVERATKLRCFACAICPLASDKRWKFLNSSAHSR